MSDKCDWCKIEIGPELEAEMVEMPSIDVGNTIISDYGLHCSNECLQREIEDFYRTHPEVVAQDLDDWLALQDSIRQEDKE